MSETRPGTSIATGCLFWFLVGGGAVTALVLAYTQAVAS